MKLRILIVEDEVFIAEMIKLYLEEQGHQVVGVCISYEEAVAAYYRLKPELTLLDIRLYGEKSGIDFAHFLQSQSEKSPFIYLTAQHDRRIFNLALKTTPYGYLTKPLQRVSLWTTVESAYQLFLDKKADTILTITDGRKKHRVNEEEIVYIKSDHVYSNIHLANDETILTRKPLGQLLESIQSQILFQCHRSFIINTQYVKVWDNRTVTMGNGDIIPISRTKKALLNTYL